MIPPRFKFVGAGFLAFFLLTALSAEAALNPSGLRCESQVDLLGVDAAQPQLSWGLESDQRGDAQTAYQVLAASTSALLAAGTGDLWDSGKVTAGTHVQIPYAGATLNSSQKVYWKVRVWDSSNAPSAWSAPATWTMGVLNAGGWVGQWITPSTAATDVGSSLLRREFTVNGGLVRAVVHVSGLGQYEMNVNGRRVGEDLISPGWTKYDKTVLYDTYDITSQVQAGANAVGIMLGNGMYNIPDNNGRYVKFIGSFGPRKAIAQIRLEYANGTVQTIGTDANWKWATGPVTFNTVFGGEDYDARQEKPGWDAAGFNEAGWLAVTVTTGPGGILRGASYAAPPLRKQVEVFSPTTALAPTASSRVYDFGQNAAQIPTFQVYGPAGAKVTLASSEIVNGNGSINQSEINSPSYSTYTLKGSTAAAPETVTWHFLYIGYRYLKVDLSGGATLVSLTSTPVHSASEATGDFSCSKPLFNDIRRIIRWAQRSNLVSVLTDCPHREKLGWLEQYHLHGPSMRYEFDLEAFFRKTYTDMADSQLSNGLVPDIAPEYTVFTGDFRDSPEWGSSFVLSPEQQYEFYGDLASISRHYANIKRYVDYLTTKASGNILNHGLGDWYDFGPNRPGYGQLTPKSLTATAMYYADVKALANMARQLGKTADANTYTTLASNIRTAFNNQFYNAATGSYSTGSQTANSIPIAFGFVEEANRTKVADALVAQIRKDNNAVTAGEIGHRYMLNALAAAGRSDVVYDIHTKLANRGYAYILSQGYTALTEGWDGSSSKNHFMLGHIMEWFYHDLAGIGLDPQTPAFKKIIIRPQIVGDVTWAKATYKSIQGPITSDWKLSGPQLTLKVSVPPGSTATVYVPTLGTPFGALVVQEGATTIWQNGASTGSVSNVTFDHVESGNPLQSSVVWVVGSGNYTFSAELMPVPGGLMATPDDQKVTLSWSGSAGATGYNLKRSETSGGPYLTIAGNLNATTFSDLNVVEGKTYYYVISALSAAEESANSLETSAGSFPGGNSGFEYPKLTNFQYNPSGALWTFTAQSGNNGSGIGANGSGFTASNPAAPEGTQVAILQGFGTITKSFKTVPGLGYTITFSAAQRVGSNNGGQTWDLRMDGAAIASYAPAQTATAYTDYTASFVATASTHLLAFVGTNTRGGDNTIFLDNFRLVADGTPTNLTATPGNQEVILAWSAPQGASGYNVKRSEASGGPYALIAGNLTATTFADPNVVVGKTYYYVVSALLSAGESPNSVQASAVLSDGNLGFERPKLTTYQYNPPGAIWTFTAQSGSNGSGISANGSGFTASNPAAPEGTQVAFLQGSATVGKSFGTVAGVAYAVTFSGAQRANGNGSGQTWDLRKDGVTIASYAPAQTATAYVDYPAAFVSTASSHTLAFTGTNTRGGDNTIFLDNVRLAAIGTVIGTTGSRNNDPATTSAAVFDGNLNTAFDAAQADGAWVGLDLAAPRRITSIRYAPRTGNASRMVGGKFQGANTADFSAGVVDLYTVTAAPTVGVLTTQSITNPAGFRYVRYLSPNNGFCNLAEFQLTSVAASPAAPTALTATGGDGTIMLTWAAMPGADTYSVKGAATAGGPYAALATGLNTPGFAHSGLGDGITRYYVATATNGVGESGNSSEVSATTYTAAMKWRLANFGTTASSGDAADSADPDGDGSANAQEFVAGTDPKNSASAFRITQLAPNGGGWLVRFPTVSGKTYRLESSPSLQVGSWTTVQDSIAGTGGVVQIADPSNGAAPQRFYRAILRP